MKSKRKEMIETIQLITSIVALGLTIISVIKAVQEWSTRLD